MIILHKMSNVKRIFFIHYNYAKVRCKPTVLTLVDNYDILLMVISLKPNVF